MRRRADDRPAPGAARLDCLDADGRRAARVAIGVIDRRWDTPDAGI